MEFSELIEIISRGEDSRHQFKENVHNNDSLAAELVAFSNAEGGYLLIGVDDSGNVRGLPSDDIHRLNKMLSNVASQNVRPAINPVSENISLPDGLVMVVPVLRGVNKPYMTDNGIIYVKSGANKKPETSREEIQRMFQQAGLVHADESPISNTSVSSLDMPYFQAFFESN